MMSKAASKRSGVGSRLGPVGMVQLVLAVCCGCGPGRIGYVAGADPQPARESVADSGAFDGSAGAVVDGGGRDPVLLDADTPQAGHEATGKDAGSDRAEPSTGGTVTPGPHVVVPLSGGGRRRAAEHRVDLSVASSPPHQLVSPHYRLTLRIGAAN